MVLVLVFSSVLLTIATSFIGFIIIQSKVITQRVQYEQAGQIAEAGLNYYKWYLSHYPNDLTNGTGGPGPYVGVYNDPEGGAIGEYSLEISSTNYCGEVVSIDVVSTGYTYKDPTVTRTISAHYARPSVAEYAYIINSNVWAGSDRVIVGPYHSNGGIRMDGTNNSVVTSGQSTWTCNSSFGCSPTANQDGVFTTTSNPNTSLFAFPSAPIDFAGITVDLAKMKARAQSDGLYFGPSGKSGYNVIFNADGTVTIRRVNSTEKEPKGKAWGYYMNILKGTSLIGTYTPPPTCPVIYVEDQVWLEGTVKGKVTLAAANYASTSDDPSIILNDNILYANATSGLLAIAEYDVLVGLVVPDDMEVNGIFVAQNGHFGRNYYDNSLPSAWDVYAKRNSLTINGSIVSNGRVGTKWGCPYYCSGFEYRFNSYDRDLVASPPPLVPLTSDVYKFSDWRDK